MALDALAALAQETRLAAFRLLVRTGPEGMNAGAIAAALDVRQNTLSANLAVLARAGLVRSQRHGRTVRYFADLGGMRALLRFLMQDCCGGQPSRCEPLLDELACP